MSNPLDLPGPQFLAFYTIFGVLVIAGFWMAQAAREGGTPPQIDMSDPYMIAYLRGGANEAARVAVVSLIDRGLLVARDDETLRAASAPSGRLLPLEEAVLGTFGKSHAIAEVFESASVTAACEAYERTLAHLALLPDATIRAARRRRHIVALVLLIGFAGAKIVVALSRGRTNILFLIVLTLAFIVVMSRVMPRGARTARGNALLKDLRRLFERLRERTTQFRPGTATTDVALVAAVFGVGVLPAERFTYVKRLFPRANAQSSCGTGSSSCGSSSSSSCGGGGSDGGGGGGCGGCGGGGGGD